MGYNITYNQNLEEHDALKLLTSKVMRVPYDSDNPNATTDALFSFSNENLEEIFKNRNLKNKRVATVGSSGDQVLYSILKGCTDVTLIDANPFTLPYLELKLAAIKNLSYAEFLDYFNFENILNHKYYSKISHDLSDYSKVFWDEIFMNTDSSNGLLQTIPYKLFQSVCTYGDFVGTRDAMRFCSNKKHYECLKGCLEKDVNIEFIKSDFESFHKNLNGRYDLILLSNIYDYVDPIIFNNEVKKLKYYNLKTLGEMQIHYDFNNGLMIPVLKNDFDKMFLFRKTRVKPVKDVRPSMYRSSGNKDELSTKDCNVVYL